MIIGVPRETKSDEHRIGLTPASAYELVSAGHRVIAESGAGKTIGIQDDDYERAGAEIAAQAEDIFDAAELIIKVKEPSAQEIAWLKPDQVLFTYLHLAASRDTAAGLRKRDCIALAYETVSGADGRLPLLAPMSEVAGKLAIQAGAHALEISQGGRGTLLGGVAGTEPAKVTILGAGVVGTNAARIALGMEADVTVIDINLSRLAELDMRFGPALNTIYATLASVRQYVAEADLLVGAVLVPGAKAPSLVSEPMVREMKSGAVIVDVAIDQGGCIATSRPTTHSSPSFVKHGVVHYCVTNMPGAVARTSTFALNNATLPFITAIANKGVHQALADDVALRGGLNLYRGKVTHPAVAAALDAPYVDPIEAMKERA